MSDLEARFKKAVWLIRNGPAEKSSNETKLLFYSYFKQVRAKKTRARSLIGTMRASAPRFRTPFSFWPAHDRGPRPPPSPHGVWPRRVQREWGR